jgi:FkbM family methyltransferase
MNYEYQPTCQIAPEILDGIYARAFGGKRLGVYVEIGANNGWAHSNTWGLARAGWRGFLAEPVPELFAECCRVYKNHPNIFVAPCCVGAETGKVTLGMGDYGATLCAQYVTGPRQVEAWGWTLDGFLEEYKVPARFDLLVIDVEGAEDQVLSRFDVGRWAPKLAILERPPWRNGFTAAGYRTVYVDCINTIYERLD